MNLKLSFKPAVPDKIQGDNMKTYKNSVGEYDYSVDNLGWMVQTKHKGDDIKKYQCTRCGKISTNKNEICKVKT